MTYKERVELLSYKYALITIKENFQLNTIQEAEQMFHRDSVQNKKAIIGYHKTYAELTLEEIKTTVQYLLPNFYGISPGTAATWFVDNGYTEALGPDVCLHDIKKFISQDETECLACGEIFPIIIPETEK